MNDMFKFSEVWEKMVQDFGSFSIPNNIQFLNKLLVKY